MYKRPFQILSAVLLLCCQAPFVAEGSSATEFSSSFCAKGTVKNYLKPIQRLPRVRGLPSSGRLGIGPASLRIYPPSEPIVTGLARFDAHGGVEGSPAFGPLHWKVKSSLLRIQSHSQNVTLVAHAQRDMRSAQDFARATFGFSRRVRPGIYRLDIEIKNRKGKTLRRYQQYFRALKPRSDLRLGVNSPSFRAGESGLLRIENYGTVSAAYGFGYRLLNENGEEVPTGAIFPNVAFRLPAGTAGYCFELKLPDDLPPGKYEVLSEAINSLRHSVRLSVQISVIS
jgi:hypothetical protein